MTNTQINIQKFANQEASDTELTRQVLGELSSEISQHGRASISFSGGRTPASFLRKLALAKFDWSKVIVTLVDERWVPIEHPDSNEKLVQENFLSRIPAPKPSFIPLYTNTEDPSLAEEVLEKRLQEIADQPITVIILGVGLDGHTASFFQSCSTYIECMSLGYEKDCCFVQNVPGYFEHNRMTLTLARISNSKHVYLQARGFEKLNVLESNDSDLTIHQVARSKTISTFWSP